MQGTLGKLLPIRNQRNPVDNAFTNEQFAGKKKIREAHQVLLVEV